MCSVLCGGLLLAFYLSFYLVYYKTMKLEFSPAHDCKLLASDFNDISGREDYTALKFQFTDEKNEIRYGYGCASNKHHASIAGKSIQPYNFYEEGDNMPCRRRRRRALDVGGDVGGGGGGGGYDSGSSYSGGDYGTSDSEPGNIVTDDLGD